MSILKRLFWNFTSTGNQIFVHNFESKRVELPSFDLFKPFLNRDVNTFYSNFFFTQKKSFKPVNYDSISREENRGTIKIISDVLPDFLNKSSVRSIKVRVTELFDFIEFRYN